MKKHLLLFAAAAVLAVCFVAGEMMNPKADTLYINGNVYTVDSGFSRASILAVQGQKLLYVGSSEQEAQKYTAPHTRIVDLGGKTVLPGLIEGHMHFLQLGESLRQIDIFQKSKDEILALVAEEAQRVAPGEWIAGDGWNHELWADNSWPGKEDLDKAAPENPVVLMRADYHSVWVNSLALEVSGITADTPDPAGGEILKNEKGELLGILIDTAMDAIYAKKPQSSDETVLEQYETAQSELFKNGLTSICDAEIICRHLDILKEAYAQGKLKIRAYEMLQGTVDADKEYIEAGNKPETGLFDGRLSINAVKLYADGSLGSRSAWLCEDYSDRPGHRGNARYTDEELYEFVKRSREYGFQIGTHAIGDAAVKQVIDTYEKVLSENPLEDHRYRIEHFQIVQPEDIPKALNLGIIPAMQAVHAISDKGMAEERIGLERIRSAYAWRTVIDNGGIAVGGSDAPIEPVNPFHGLYASVSRMDLAGEPPGGWYPELAMTREEALKSFTIWAAYGQFEEDVKGSLEPGKYADFIVIDRDIMTCPTFEIKDAQVLTTVLGGEVVYERM